MLNGFALRGKKVAVTGGGGFLGRHVVQRLLEAGANVSCLARPASAAAYSRDVRVIRGDCLDAAAVKSFLRGEDILIHMAGLLFGFGWRDYLAANSAAVQNIADVCQRSSDMPGRVVFVSSLAACGPCGTSPGLDETARPAPVSAYGWSKLCAEAILGRLGPRLVIVRPPIIYGSGDRGLLPLFQSIKKSGIGVSPGAFRKFPVSVIHARDAATAILLACGEKASGVYHLSDGYPTDMDAFCAAAASALGKKVTVMHPPLALMGASALGASLWARLPWPGRKRPPSWNLDKFREARQAGWLADARRIGRDLGFQPEMALEAGMEEAVKGYHAEGWL